MFQYKVLNNVLDLNNMLFKFKKFDFPLGSYCNEEEEMSLHLFNSCLKTKKNMEQKKKPLTIYRNLT